MDNLFLQQNKKWGKSTIHVRIRDLFAYGMRGMKGLGSTVQFG